MEGPLTGDQVLFWEKIGHAGPMARFLQNVRCIRITGPVDAGRFEEAVSRLAQRHPIICSQLYFRHDELRQRQDGGMPAFEVVETDGDEQHIDSLLSGRADIPLDLFNESPLKIVMVRDRAAVNHLMLIGHHMFFDGAALNQLVAEYVDLVLNPAQQAAAPAWDTGDRSFLAWAVRENNMISDASIAGKMRYWLDSLSDADPLIHFPERRADPELQTEAAIRFKLDLAEVQAFQNRARRLRVTRFSLAASAVFQ